MDVVSVQDRPGRFRVEISCPVVGIVEVDILGVESPLHETNQIHIDDETC